MRIMHIIDLCAAGGVSNVVHDLCSAPLESGKDVSIIVILKTADDKDTRPVPKNILVNSKDIKKSIRKLCETVKEVALGTRG